MSSTYSINVGQVTESTRKPDIFNVLEENPDLLNKIKNGTLSVEDAHKEIYTQISKNKDTIILFLISKDFINIFKGL